MSDTIENKKTRRRYLTDLRREFHDELSQVAYGKKPLVVLNHRKPYVVIIPVEMAEELGICVDLE
jgi:prevent-host-death family protein